MIGSVFCLLAFHSSTITLPPAYYTLESLAQECTAQGTAVKADPNCSADTYAIAAEGLSWEQLKAALTADERLSIVKKDDAWTITRLQTGLVAEKGQWDRYWNYILATAQALYGRTTSEIKAYDVLSSEEKATAIDAYTRSNNRDPLIVASNRLIYLCGDARDILYVTVSLPEYLSRPKNPVAPGNWVEDSLYNFRALMDPRSDLTSMSYIFGLNPNSASISEIEAVAKRVKAAGKWMFEPSTASLGTLFALRLDATEARPQAEVSMTTNHFPEQLAVTAPSDRVFTRSEMSGFSGRSSATDMTLASGKAAEASSPLPYARMSSNILKWAKETKANVVSYVSPFTDFSIAITENLSLSRMLNSVNAVDFVEYKGGLYVRRMSEADIQMKPMTGVSIPKKYTVANVDGVYVVRNELRFMDGFCVTSAFPSIKLANAAAAGKPSKLMDLAELVHGLKIGSWIRSNFSKQYYDFCDPVAFKPFASAMVASTKFREFMEGVAATRPVTVEMNELDPAAMLAIQAGLNEVASKFDFREDYDLVQLDPRLVRDRVGASGFKGLKLQVRKSQQGLIVEMLDDVGQRVWLSRLSGIEAK